MKDEPGELWAWAHEEPATQTDKVDASRVLAVLVAHNGDQWLPQTLSALAHLDTRPGQLIGVDAGSTDGSRAVLDAAPVGLFTAVLAGDANVGYGDNVRKAIGHATGIGFEPEWLWLLHDDSAPNSRALAELLRATEPDASGVRPAILVPKLLQPKRRNHPDQMSAVGESIARSGIRVLTVEPGDIDQQQEDSSRVLGASTAGLLVAMSAWRDLGGLNPAVPLFRDGVDLGWRANARGLLVRTCPRAALRHAEAGRVGLRDSVLAPDSVQADLAAGMMVVAAHSDAPGRTIARLSAQSVISAIGYLIGKSPRLAASQLRAAAQVRRSRAEATELARVNSQATSHPVEGLLPDKGWGFRRFLDRTAGRVTDYFRDLAEDDDDGGMIDELTGDDFAGGQRRIRFLSPSIIGMVAMLALTLLASRELIGFGLLSGPQLLPAPGTLAAAWANWALAEPTLAGSNPGWLGFMALGSTLSLGQPDWFATLLILGGPALASWTAFHFLRPIVGPGWWTPVLACLWGILLPVLGATNQGSLTVTVVAIGLPALGSGLRRWVFAPTGGAEGWRAPAWVALVVGVMASFAPLLWVGGALVAIGVAVHRRDPRGGLVAVLGPVAMLACWLPRVYADPGRLLVTADPGTLVAGNAPAAWRVLLGAAHLPGTPVWFAAAVVAVVWIVGAYGAVRAREMMPLVGWVSLVTAVLAPVAGIALSLLIVTVAGVATRPDPTVFTLIGLFALVVLAAHGIGRPPQRTVDDSAEDLAQHKAATRTRSLLGALISIGLVTGAAWWLLGGTAHLNRSTGFLPTYVTGVQDSLRVTQTLLVDLSSGTARYNLSAANHPAWGDAESPLPAADPSASEAIRQVAQQFAQGQPSDDLSQRLATLGIGHVWLRGASPEQLNNLSETPLLGMAQADEISWVFTVETLPSWALLSSGGAETGLIDAQVPTADADALIVLSRPADPSWRASIDGRELTTVASPDWRQTWSTDGLSGTLRVWQTPDWGGVALQVLAVLVLLVLVAPTAQRAHAPRRALPPGGAGRSGVGNGGAR